MADDKEEKKNQLLNLIRDMIQQDKDLREKFNIGDKFRFIRDRLHALLTHAEESLKTVDKEIEKQQQELAEDEMVVYVYLFNVQGLVLQSWQKMLKPSVFYEYSINRPIYVSKSAIQSLIKNKANSSQHGYLTIIIKKKDLLTSAGDADQDKSIAKVKEGSLRFEKLITFTYNNQDYIVNEQGEFKKKV